MLVAITRRVSPAIGRCELTYAPRQVIDAVRADHQHRRYESLLVDAGCGIDRLPVEPDLPDSVFVEDTAVVLDELAVLTRPGAVSRRAEVSSVATILGTYRELAYIEAPGTLDGGDVLTVGRRIFVGIGHRTNEEGAAQLRRLLKPFGYSVVAVLARNCLHLKSAVTCLAENTLLINPDWTEPDQFPGCEMVEIDRREPDAANVLRVNDRIIAQASFPHTRAVLEERDFAVTTADLSELAKAEGAVTCCSLVFERAP